MNITDVPIRKSGYKLSGFDWHRNRINIIYGYGDDDTLTYWQAYKFLRERLEAGDAVADVESARRFIALQEIFKGLREE